MSRKHCSIKRRNQKRNRQVTDLFKLVTIYVARQQSVCYTTPNLNKP
ncbi:MAG TPA: hypothetical protein EYG50_08260 [Cycloclasticus sp.]|nr:hypothetical protein [Cycloclasticus sp.]HIL92715.1 hypothetical protein [Cycloclasticus sp.]